MPVLESWQSEIQLHWKAGGQWLSAPNSAQERWRMEGRGKPTFPHPQFNLYTKSAQHADRKPHPPLPQLQRVGPLWATSALALLICLSFPPLLDHPPFYSILFFLLSSLLGCLFFLLRGAAVMFLRCIDSMPDIKPGRKSLPLVVCDLVRTRLKSESTLGVPFSYPPYFAKLLGSSHWLGQVTPKLLPSEK